MQPALTAQQYTMKKMFTYGCVSSETGEVSTLSQFKTKQIDFKSPEEVSSANVTTHSNTQKEAFSAQGNFFC